MPQYVDYAEYYDFDHTTDIDIDFYLDYARRCGSPVLELACGTGRLLIPLAQAGFDVYGLDLSENMLAHCRRKVSQFGLGDRVHLTQSSMTAFDLARKDFTLCCIAVRSFMHLFNQADQILCLQHTYNHLCPGGVLIIDIYAPNYKSMSLEPDGSFQFRRKFDLPNGNHVIRQDRFVRNDPVNQIQHFEIRFEEYNPSGELIHQRTLPLDTRYTFRFELSLLLERVGFVVDDIYRDFQKNPYDGTGEILAVARRPL